MEQEQIDAVAREIRRYYIERKNLLYNGKFKLTGSNAEFVHWQRAAAVCIELKATPEVFVDAAFANCKSSMGPFPNAMYGYACRGWYREYIAGRPGFTKVKEAAETAGRDLQFDAENDSSVLDLKYDIDLVKRSLQRLTGFTDINEVTIEYINSLTTSYPAYVRVLLGYKNEKVKQFFGSDALELYSARPNLYRAAETLGYPIREILKWLSAPKN